jgi:hypothetical protein
MAIFIKTEFGESNMSKYLISRDVRLKTFVISKFFGMQIGKLICLNCGREVKPQNIKVYDKDNHLIGLDICICRLYKYLKNDNKVFMEGKEWKWKDDWRSYLKNNRK